MDPVLNDVQLLISYVYVREEIIGSDYENDLKNHKSHKTCCKEKLCWHSLRYSNDPLLLA